MGIHEASSDNRNRYINTHRYLCEISPHVLYQYMMLVLWFMLVMGIAISSIGFISHIVSCFCKCLTLRAQDHGFIYPLVTFRRSTTWTIFYAPTVKPIMSLRRNSTRQELV